MAPIEEDVPEEFFDPDAFILHGVTYWPVNWEIGLENSMDSHVNYLHRNALLMLRTPFARRGATGEQLIFVGNGFSGDPQAEYFTRQQPAQDEYAELGWKWPKHNYRRFWTWLFTPFVQHALQQIPAPKTARWAPGHRLPGMYRTQFMVDFYTRQTVAGGKSDPPVVLPLHRPRHAAQRLWRTVMYYLLHKWVVEYNFSAGRQCDAQPALCPRKTLWHRRRGHPVAAAHRHQASGRPQRLVCLSQSRRSGDEVPLERIYRGPARLRATAPRM